MLLRRIAVVLVLLGNVIWTSAQALTLGFTLADPGLGAPGGYFHPGSPEGAGRMAALVDVKTYLESVIPNPGTVKIELSTFSGPGVATLASGGQFFSGLSPIASGIVLGDSQLELLRGVPIDGANGFLSFNATKSFYLGSDPAGIGPGTSDFRSVVLHELTHALGFASFMKPDDKTSALTDFLKAADPVTYAGLGEVYSLYDSFLVDSMSFLVVLPSGVANPDALPIGGASVASPLAIVANGGELVSTAVIPFIDGDLTHLASSVASVMNPTLASGTVERVYTDVDLAILMDLGYVAAVPEADVWALFVCGLGLLLVRMRLVRRGRPYPAVTV